MQNDGICLDYSHIYRKYTLNEITKLLNEENKFSYAKTKQNKEDWNKNESIRKKNAHLNYNQARSIAEWFINENISAVQLSKEWKISRTTVYNVVKDFKSK